MTFSTIVSGTTPAARRAGLPALSAGFLVAQSLTLNAISLFSTAYIVRHLGVLQYGEWAAASSLAAAHLVITNFGLRTLFVRDLAKGSRDTSELLAEQLGVRLALGALACVSSMAIAFFAGYPAVVLVCTAIGCIWILVSVVWSTFGDLVQSMERFGRYSAVSVAAGLAVTVASVAVAKAGAGPIGLSIAYLTMPVVTAALFWRDARRRMPVTIAFRWERAKALLGASRLLGLSAVMSVARDRAEQLLIPAMVGFDQFGLFSAGIIVAERLIAVPDAISSAFYPRISKASVESLPAAGRSVVSALTVGLAASLPIAIVGAYFAPHIANVLLRTDVDRGARIIEITIFSVPLLTISMCMTVALQAAGFHERAARRGIAASIVSACVSVTCVMFGGASGAMWSYVARPAIVALALGPLFVQIFPGTASRLPLVRIGGCAAVLSALCWTTRNGGPAVAVAVAIAGLAIYATALLATRVFSFAIIRDLLGRASEDA